MSGGHGREVSQATRFKVPCPYHTPKTLNAETLSVYTLLTRAVAHLSPLSDKKQGTGYSVSSPSALRRQCDSLLLLQPAPPPLQRRRRPTLAKATSRRSRRARTKDILPLRRRRQAPAPARLPPSKPATRATATSTATATTKSSAWQSCSRGPPRRREPPPLPPGRRPEEHLFGGIRWGHNNRSNQRTQPP